MRVGTYPTNFATLDRYSYGRRLLGLRFVASQKLTTPLNLPAPGRRQPLYITLRFSRDLCFDKQSLGPIHCGSSGLAPKEHPFSPKLRGHFAEFLNESSLAHLRILILTTCVGLRYGHLLSILEAFLGSVKSTTRETISSPHHSLTL